MYPQILSHESASGCGVFWRRFVFFASLVPLMVAPLAISVSLGNPVVSQRNAVGLSIATAWLIYLLMALFSPKRRKTALHGCDFWVGIFLGATALSVLLSPDRLISFHAAFPFLMMGSYYFLLARTMNSPRCEDTIFALLGLLAAIVSLVGILQYIGIDPLPYVAERRNVKQVVLSTLGHPNYVASFIAPVLFLLPPLLFAAMSRPWRKAAAIGSILAAFLLLACLVMTGARGASLALAVSFVFFLGGFLWIRRKSREGFAIPRFFWRIGMALAAAFALLLTLLLIPNPLVKSRFDLVQRATSAKEVRTRFFYWAVAGEMFARKPLFGIGYHRFSSTFWAEAGAMQERDPRNRVFQEYQLRVPTGVPGQAHNEFFEIAAEQGIVGVSTFLGMLLFFFMRGIGILGKIAAPVAARWKILCILSALMLMLVDSCFGFPLQLPASGLLFWALLALLRAALQDYRNYAAEPCSLRL